VKEYRRHCSEEGLDTIEDCGNRFLRFIEEGYPADGKGHVPIISVESMESDVRRRLLSMWSEILDEAGERLYNKTSNEFGKEGRDKGHAWLLLSPDELIAHILFERKSEERTPRVLPESYVLDVGRGLDRIFEAESFKEAMNEISFPVSAEPYLEDIKTMFRSMVLSEEPLGDATGIVIPGFGLNRMFPAFIEYRVDGCFWGKLKCSEVSRGEITNDNSAIIKTFAQKDVAETFLWGIDPNLRERIIHEFRRFVENRSGKESTQRADGLPVTSDDVENTKKQTTDSFIEWLDHATYWAFVDPVIQSVNFLSKKELSQMAESLINLTSLRRRVSLNAVESVGGPVDVAIISKGDGLIWINRKHYFDIALNPHYDGTR